jgi:hypothetical protein
VEQERDYRGTRMKRLRKRRGGVKFRKVVVFIKV